MVSVQKRRWLSAVLALLLILAVNVLGHYFYARFDLTREGRFTLNKSTKELLAKSGSEIRITVFLDGELPAAFRRLQHSVGDLLTDYQAYARGDFKVTFVDPLAGLGLAEQDTVIRQLYQLGVEGTTLNIKNDSGFAQRLVFPMAIVEASGRQIPVKLLQNQDATGNYEEHINSSIENLEYAFTSAIQQVMLGDRPRIGFSEGNGELPDLLLQDAIKSLSLNYEVGRVNLSIITRQGLDNLKLIIIAKPQREFTEAEKYKLNYFIRNGGNVVWAIDQVGAELDSMGRSGEQLAFNRSLNLDDMLFLYGARVNYNLIADANCAEIPLSMGAQAQIQMAPWVYYPLLMPDTAVSLVRNLDGIRTEFVSTVDTIGVRGLRKRVILKTSAFNKVHSTPKLLTLQMVAEQPDPRDYASAPKSAAVLIEGEFPSVFLNRPVPEGITENYPQRVHGKPAKIIVIGDGDVFKNQVSSRDGSAFPLGFDRYTQRNFGNKSLLLNIADYMANENNLIALRDKEVKIRLLDRARIRAEKAFWQILNIILPVALLILFAIFQHYYRKRRYAR